MFSKQKVKTKHQKENDVGRGKKRSEKKREENKRKKEGEKKRKKRRKNSFHDNLTQR